MTHLQIEVRAKTRIARITQLVRPPEYLRENCFQFPPGIKVDVSLELQ